MSRSSRIDARRAALAVLLAGAVGLTACDSSSRVTPDSGGPTGDAAGPDAGPADAGDGPIAAADLPRGKSCDEEPDPQCEHPVNREMVPLLRGAGVPLDEATATEVCRRMAIDLLGRIPSPEEMESCVARPAGGRADLFQGMPEYEGRLKRRFAEVLGYDVYLSWYAYLVELDALVGRHAREELAYDQAIAELVLHPGFYSRHPGDDWTRAFFDVAFGRSAREDEVRALRPLWIIWQPRIFCDGAIWYQLSAFGEDTANFSCFRLEYGLNFCACETGYGYIGCRSDALGTEIDYGQGGCLLQSDFGNPLNLLRSTAASPGRPPRCPTGYPREACGDREYSFETYTPLGPLTPLADGTDRRAGMVTQMAAALRNRSDFYEAAVDRELRSLLGWWQTGFRRPDSDLPAVRQVLVDELRRTHSLRAVQRMIVTSLLYTLPAERAVDPAAAPATAPTERPAWTLGPSKFLAAEAWLDSVGLALGEQLGACDPRFISAVVDGADPYFVDSALLDPVEGSLGSRFTPEAYQSSAVLLGGCAADQARPTVSSIGVVAAQRDLGQRLCAMGRAVLPAGVDGASTPDDAALATVADHLHGRLLSRSATDDERSALTGEMRACLEAAAEPGQGCQNLETAARWACQRLIDSAEFAIY